MKKKTKQNLQKRRVPAYFRHFRPKKIFLKNRTLSCFEHFYAHLCAKNQKKLMIKSRENAKKRFFRHISGIFGRKNTFFENRTPSHFGHYHFCVSVQNFMKKYQVQPEIFKKYCFSGENWLFRLFLDSSGFKNKFF